MSRMGLILGFLRLFRGLSDIVKPRFVTGAFLCLVGLEWADAVAEFVGETWFGVACEEVLVFDDFAEFGEPVA